MFIAMAKHLLYETLSFWSVPSECYASSMNLIKVGMVLIKWAWPKIRCSVKMCMTAPL